MRLHRLHGLHGLHELHKAKESLRAAMSVIFSCGFEWTSEAVAGNQRICSFNSFNDVTHLTNYPISREAMSCRIANPFLSSAPA
jgi:hypothetical protein